MQITKEFEKGMSIFNVDKELSNLTGLFEQVEEEVDNKYFDREGKLRDKLIIRIEVEAPTEIELIQKEIEELKRDLDYIEWGVGE